MKISGLALPMVLTRSPSSGADSTSAGRRRLARGECREPVGRRAAAIPCRCRDSRITVPVDVEGARPDGTKIVRYGRNKTYLSADERAVYTDYVIIAIRVLYEPPTQSCRPGGPRTVTVKRWG